MISDEQKYTLIQSGYRLLKGSKGYGQRKTVDKLAVLGYQTTPPSFNKVIKNNKTGAEVATIIYEGILALVQQELCLQPDTQLVWQPIKNCTPTVVEVAENAKSEGFIFHTDGRLSIEQKVVFLEKAQTRVIEFGTTLNTFSEYFVSRKAADFKLPIQRLLERGVDVECYLLDPEWNGTRLYFNDRSRASEGGKDGLEKIRNTLYKLKIVSEEYAALQLSGQFKVFTYRHFPFNYFLAVDPDNSKTAQMMFSNYLYGTKRANCPVMQFSRTTKPTLFLCYQNALQKLTADAKPVDWSKISG